MSIAYVKASKKRHSPDAFSDCMEGRCDLWRFPLFLSSDCFFVTML